ENALASWLLSPADIATIQERQKGGAELRDRLDLREELAVLGESAGVGVQPEQLVRWAESPNRLVARWILPVAVLMPLLVIGAVVFWNSSGLVSPLIAILAIEFGVMRSLRDHLADVFRSTEEAFDSLRLLAELTERLESEPVQSPLAKRLVAQLSS